MAKRSRAYPGMPLADMRGVSQSHKARLAELWITTAEELLALCQNPVSRKGILRVLDIRPKQLDQLLRTVLARIPADRKPARPEPRHAPDYALGALQPPLPELRKALARSAYVTVRFPKALPDSVDLRSTLSPVLHQGRRQTCVAFAATALRESIEKTAGLKPVDLSEQFLYWSCKQHDGAKACGTWVRVALERLLKQGQCQERAWRYRERPTRCPDAQGPPPAEAGKTAGRFRVKRIIKLNPRSVEDIKTCLAEGKVVPFSVPVFSSWHTSPAVRTCGRISLPLPGDAGQGGHAMCLVGYQDDRKAPGGGFFILRNSWGPDWAARSPYGPGYGTIPYEYIRRYAWEAYSADRDSSTDLYIRDHPKDDGNLPCEATFNSPDIWLRNQPDSAEEHENPVFGQDNYVYVRVHNKGPNRTRDVKVQIYYHVLSPAIFEQNWTRLGVLRADRVEPGKSLVIGPLAWRPPRTQPFCYLARLESPDDPILHDFQPQWDNNVAQKNLHTFDAAPGSTHEAGFYIGGVKGAAAQAELVVDRSSLPAGTEAGLQMLERLILRCRLSGLRPVGLTGRHVRLVLDQDQAAVHDIPLRPGERALCRVIVHLPEVLAAGASERPLVVTQKLGELVVGKVTLLFRFRPSAPALPGPHSTAPGRPSA